MKRAAYFILGCIVNVAIVVGLPFAMLLDLFDAALAKACPGGVAK